MPSDIAFARVGYRATSPLLLGLILSILLLATLLRLYRLDAQSLSGDEILTVYASRSGDIQEFRASSAGLDHPPLYFILLKGWRAMAGDSEFSLRFISLVASVATVALLYQLVRTISSPAAGVTASLIASVSPFFVYFGQESRGYALMLCVMTLSVYLLTRIIAEGGGRYWLMWAGACIAALFTEYVAAPLVLAQSAFLLLLLVRGALQMKGWRWWFLANGMIAAALLPWFLTQNVVNEVYTHDGGSAASLGQMVKATVSAFTTGRTLEPLADWKIMAPILLIAGLGVLYRPVTIPTRLSVLGFLLIPIALTYGIAGSGLGFDPRHIVAAAPGIVILLAWGLLWVKARAGPLYPGAYLIFLLPNLLYLASYYFEPFSGRDDLRAGARYLDDVARPGDVVVFNAPWGAEVFPYYLRSSTE
ncbi:MAG: conserved rane protein of unknown function, partial [Dehalococcoidia bacterium]|nr:conserved rane protein of unknown function [Dehalococcoidia bacterium]